MVFPKAPIKQKSSFKVPDFIQTVSGEIDYRIRFRSYETPRNEQITPKNRKLNPRGKGVSEKHHFFRAKIALNP